LHACGLSYTDGKLGNDYLNWGSGGRGVPFLLIKPIHFIIVKDVIQNQIKFFLTKSVFLSKCFQNILLKTDYLFVIIFQGVKIKKILKISAKEITKKKKGTPLPPLPQFK
jgi:hypothetical protein